MPSVIENLRAVGALLSDESKWTKGRFARDSDGDGVSTGSRRAVCWCLHGACMRVAGGIERELLHAAIHEQTGFIAAFNDSPAIAFTDVKEAIADAIQRQEASHADA